jgi:hypothetical protein
MVLKCIKNGIMMVLLVKRMPPVGYILGQPQRAFPVP